MARTGQHSEGIAIVEIGHHLDGWGVRQLWRTTRTLLGVDSPADTLALDMAETWTIDSEGLTFVDQLARQCAADGHAVVVTDASWEIRKVLVDAGLTDDESLDAGGRRCTCISPRTTRPLAPATRYRAPRAIARDAMAHDPTRMVWDRPDADRPDADRPDADRLGV